MYLFQTPICKGDKYGQNELLFCQDTIHHELSSSKPKSNSTEEIKDFH